jgi:hypothetical protein
MQSRRTSMPGRLPSSPRFCQALALEARPRAMLLEDDVTAGDLDRHYRLQLVRVEQMKRKLVTAELAA